MDEQEKVYELYEKALKAMREYSANRVYGESDAENEVESNDGWIPLIFENGEWKEDERLKDHWYYLVAHKAFSTPMKAKYHDDGALRCFQIVSQDNRDIRWRHNYDDVYAWSDSITHWRELPEMPEVDGVIFGDKKYWEE